MTGSPFLDGLHFFVESNAVPYGRDSMRFRFVFNEFGPQVEMEVQGKWVPMRDYTHYGLAPEDLPQMTFEDLATLIDLFERSIRHMSPGATFIRGTMAPSQEVAPAR